MSKFGIIMTLKGSPMPPEVQAQAMVIIQKSFMETAASLGMEVECKVVPMPENYDLNDLKCLLIASV